jgi:hypothetical protein
LFLCPLTSCFHCEKLRIGSETPFVVPSKSYAFDFAGKFGRKKYFDLSASIGGPTAEPVTFTVENDTGRLSKTTVTTVATLPIVDGQKVSNQ